MKTRPMYKFLIILTITAAIGLQGWRTLFNNFAVDKIGLGGMQIGVIQSIREIPGFLALLALIILRLMREHHLSSVSIIILGIGVGLTGFFPSYYGLMTTTLLMSLGFHYYETTNQSLTLQYFDEHEAPLMLGIQKGLSAASNIAAGVVIFCLASIIDYKYIYLIIGIAVMCMGIWALTQNPGDDREMLQHKKMVFRKKYTLFYILTILAGARRQIFVVFSVFLLVKKFQFTIQEITILFVVNNIINYFICPLIGKIIVKTGERNVLFAEYASLIIIFCAYAFTSSKIVVIILYILDHVFFNFAFAIRTYFQKIGRPGDFMPTMAVSFTLNHITAIILPAIGGVLWAINYRIPFLAGAGLSLMSLIAVSQLPKKPLGSTAKA